MKIAVVGIAAIVGLLVWADRVTPRAPAAMALKRSVLAEAGGPLIGGSAMNASGMNAYMVTYATSTTTYVTCGTGTVAITITAGRGGGSQ